MNAWPEIRHMSMADAVRDPPTAPAMTGGNFPVGGNGSVRYACVRLSAVCHLACHAEMANCLVVAFWNASVFGLRWLGRKGVAASRARSMQRWMPAIENLDWHLNGDADRI